MDKACPKCSEKITKNQKFCTKCRWSIDPNIFTSKNVCTGRTDECKTCGMELDPNMKYCPECGTEQGEIENSDQGDSEVLPKQTNNKNTNIRTPTEHQIANQMKDVKHKSDMSYSSVGSKNSDQAVLLEKQASGPSCARLKATANESAIQKTHNQRVNVTFHCIVEPSMLKNLAENTLYVVFEESSHGEGGAKKYAFKQIRTLASSYIEYECVVSMQTHEASNPQKYNYLMMQGKKAVKEYVYSRNTKYHASRTFHITESNVKTGEYHSFDGVIRKPSSKNTLEQLKGFFGFDNVKVVLKKDADIALEAFLPRWKILSIDAEGVNGEDLINSIKFVFDGLKDVYVKLAELWNRSEFIKVVGSSLKPTILKILHDLQKRKEKLSIEAKILHLVTAITIAYLVMKYKIDIENREINMLCELLLPQLDFQKSRLYDMNALLSFFPQTKDLVSQGVLNFSKLIASKTSNPKWTFCLPIIHFLYEKCVPYVHDDVKVNHAEAIPEWWGITELKSEIEQFKSKAQSWDSSTCEVLEVLSLYFQMDYLLPRSFMTALKQEQIFEVVSSGFIPSDAILAEILKKWFDQILQKNSEVTRNKITLSDAMRSYKIAAEVLQYNLEKKTTNRFVAMEMFLKSIYIYDEIQNVSNFQSQEFSKLGIMKDVHLALFERITLEFCECLSGDRSGNELEYLKRWNDALKVRIPNGRIRDMYLKSVEDHLKAGIDKLSYTLLGGDAVNFFGLNRLIITVLWIYICQYNWFGQDQL